MREMPVKQRNDSATQKPDSAKSRPEPRKKSLSYNFCTLEICRREQKKGSAIKKQTGLGKKKVLPSKNLDVTKQTEYAKPVCLAIPLFSLHPPLPNKLVCCIRSKACFV
jgi:hypothetical protein